VGVVDEILRKTATSQYLKERIDLADASALLQAVGELAELIDLASVAIPSIVRDANDDFLIAAALEGNADFLVTGDADLLALSGVIQKLHIVRPGEFLLQLTEW
jgi:putative PIN family toxin of toxin-antitoxin system